VIPAARPDPQGAAVALSFSSRAIGDITVVKCEGAIVEGAASIELRQHVDDALRHTLAIVLDLSGVHFIDSAGLGLLVRILARTGQDRLKLCGLTSRVSETLKITRLASVFDCHESEAEAIAAFYDDSTRPTESSAFVAPNVLCVEKSADLLTYMQEVLRQAGLRVMTTDNLPDAVTLLKAVTPKVVLVNPEFRSSGSTGIVETFNRLVKPLAVVELPSDFARQDPSETGPQLVERVRVLIGGSV
jgi:anti-sigma B factor antagonist